MGSRAATRNPGKSLLQQDGPPGYQTIINVLEFAPGAREVRHTIPVRCQATSWKER